MKSLIRKLPLLVLCYIVSATALASGSIGWTKIKMLNQRSCEPNFGLEITFTTAHLNPDVCTNSRTVDVDCDLPIYKQILAMALTAQVADMEVNGYVNACDTQGQAKLEFIRIR